MDELFDLIRGDADAVSKTGFVQFFKDKVPDSTLPEDAAEKLLSDIAGEDATLDKEKFKKLLALHLRVTKNTVFTSDFDLKLKTKACRRIEEDEILIALGPQKKDEDTGTTRQQCKAIGDDAEGWVTSAGNKGTMFMEPQSNYYICRKETDLTDVFSSTDAKATKVINVGDVLEIIEHAQKDKSGARLFRTKVKLLSGSGDIGFATTVKGDERFLESC